MQWGGSDRLWYGWLNEEKSEPERAEKVPWQKQNGVCHLTMGSSIKPSIIFEMLISHELRSSGSIAGLSCGITRMLLRRVLHAKATQIIAFLPVATLTAAFPAGSLLWWLPWG